MLRQVRAGLAAATLISTVATVARAQPPRPANTVDFNALVHPVYFGPSFHSLLIALLPNRIAGLSGLATMVPRSRAT